MFEPPGRSAVERALRAARAHQVDRRRSAPPRRTTGRRVGPRKRAGDDADDRERHAADRQRPADDAGVALEAALPERSLITASGRRGRRRADRRPRVEQPAERRRTPSVSKKRPLHHQRLDRVGLAAVRQIEPLVGPGQGAGDATGHPIAQRFPDRIGPAPAGRRRPARRGARPAATAAGARRPARRSRCWRRCRGPSRAAPR